MRTSRPSLALLLVALLVVAVAVAPPAGAGPEAPEAGEAALTGVASAHAGNVHSCVRLVGGQLRCWGTNDDGQVGDGTFNQRLLPVTVLRPDGGGPLTGVTQVSAGFHTCARRTTGRALCWGQNAFGQLGGGVIGDQPLPVPVLAAPATPLTGVAEIQAGDGFTCARLTSGQVRCWGEGEHGRLGNGETDDQPLPVPVLVPGGARLTGVTQLTVGRSHACARLADGRARCWGDNFYGSVGDGGSGAGADRATARLVRTRTGTGPLTGVSQISAGDTHTCAVLTSRQARCWGYNGNGQLGIGNQDAKKRPQTVSNGSGTGPLTGVTAIRASQSFTCARLRNGQARCWGSNSDQNLGDGSVLDQPRPRVVQRVGGGRPLTGVTGIWPGGAHVCARLGNQTAVCWGDNTAGVLGNGNQIQSGLPVPVQSGP